MMDHEDTRSPADVFDRFFGPALFVPWTQVLLEYAAPQPGERVLDLACGTGTVARHVAPLVGESGRVVAVDINPGMLAVARARPAPDGAAITWMEGDAIHLDLANNSFDIVLCQQGLQFFPDRIGAVRQIWRVLEEGGRVALDLWQALEFHPLYEALSEAEARYLDVPLAELTTPFSLSDAETLRVLLSEEGFQQIEITPMTLDVHFPSPERFVYLTLFAATAFLPEFDWNDEALRNDLIDSISTEIEPLVSRYRDGHTLTFPVSWHVATAVK